MKEKKRGNVFSSLITKLRFITKTHISIINSKLKRNVLKIKKDSSIQFNNSSVAKSNIKLSGGSNAQIYGELYKCIIDICGTNNNLIIEEGCSLRNLTLIIKGTSCTIKIKKNTSCNGGCMICMGRANHINIGESCMFADNVDIWASDTHPIFNEANELTNPSAPIEIADSVWLGRHAKILKGVRIGEGAVIGMGTIVTKDITPRSLNAGIPAKCIKTNIRWNKGCIANFE